MRKIGLALCALGLIAGGWTVLWAQAAKEAGRRLDTALADERQRGRVWTCANRQITGFPFTLALSCDHLDIDGLVLADSSKGSVGALEARFGLPDPRHATVTLNPPFNYRTADGRTAFSLGWTRMTVDVDHLASSGKTATATGSDLTFHGDLGPMGSQTGAAAKGMLSLSNVVDALSPTADFAIAIEGAAVAALDPLFGDQKPADLSFAGRVDHAVFQDATSAEALIDRWRLAGGAIDVSAARITRGPSAATATGTVRLDDLHRPTGAFDATFKGAGPILRRYGINPNLAAAGSLLNSLFGRRMPVDKARPLDGDTLNLPITLTDGRLGIGPLRLPVTLPPLY